MSSFFRGRNPIFHAVLFASDPVKAYVNDLPMVFGTL